jgi:hypothetical protein
MKTSLLSFCLLFVGFSVFSQVDQKELKSFANDVCKCVDSFDNSNLKGCVMVFKDEGKHATVVSELTKSKYNLNSEIMKMVQLSLVNTCDAYGDYILRKAGMDIDAPFDPSWETMGVSLCDDFSKLTTLSDQEIDKVVIGFCQTNEKKLIETYGTPGKAMREVMRYGVINCPMYRRYIMLQSLAP